MAVLCSLFCGQATSSRVASADGSGCRVRKSQRRYRSRRLFEEFPWSLSAEERVFVARNLDQAPEIGVSYESHSTRPLRITHATARSVEVVLPTGISPLYVVSLSFRVENTTSQAVTAFACSLSRVGFESDGITLRLHRSIPARRFRQFSIPSVVSPLHFRYLPIVFTEQPSALNLNIDGVCFLDGTSWGAVEALEAQPAKVSRTRPIPDGADSQPTTRFLLSGFDWEKTSSRRDSSSV